MLSHTLPPNIAIPAASQTLFLGVVNHAVASPSSASMKPVYQLLKGGLAPLLGLLSHDILTQLEHHFHEILRSTVCQTDQCLTLYCLVIMKIMIQAAEDELSCTPGSFYETQELLASTPDTPRWKPTELQRYFTGSKVNRALHLVVLRVIGATKVEGEAIILEANEVLCLATEIIEYLPTEVREKWCTDNPIIVRKIWEKASQPDLHRQTQVQVIAFNAGLCESQALPQRALDSLAAILSDPASLAAVPVSSSGATISRFAHRLSRSQISDMLTTWTSFAAIVDDKTLVTHAAKLSENLMAIKSTLNLSEMISTGVLSALSAADVGEHLRQLKNSLLEQPALACQSDMSTCTRSARQARSMVAQALSGLYLQAALRADHSQTDVASDLYPLLVCLHALSSKQSATCQHHVVRTHVSAMGSEHMDTLSTPRDIGWRTSVQQHLEAKAKSEHSDLARIFANACADLERRCTEVEAPLREEQARSSELQRQYDDLMEAYEALQDEKRRIDSHATAAKAERAASAKDVDEARSENDDLMLRIEELGASLVKSQQEIREQIAKATEAAELAEIGHAATIAQQQEELDEAKEKFERAGGDLRKQVQHEADLVCNLDTARSEADGLRKRIAEHEAMDAEHGEKLASLEQAKLDARATCRSLETELQRLQDDLLAQKSAQEMSVLQAQQQSDKRLAMVQAEQAEHIAAIHAEREEQVRGLESQISALQDESHQAQTKLCAQLAKRDRKLASNAKRIDDLKRLCATKDNQLAEAHAMRSNLMAAMGLANDRTQGTQSRRVTRSAAAMQDSFEDTEASIDPGVNRQPTPDTIEISMEHASLQAKRAKTNRTPGILRESTAAKSVKSAARLPLLAISVNRTPSNTPRAKTPGTKLRDFSVALDDTTFDGSEVFASTPGVIQELLPKRTVSVASATRTSDTLTETISTEGAPRTQLEGLITMTGDYNPSISDSTETPSPPKRLNQKRPTNNLTARRSPRKQQKTQRQAAWTLPGSNREGSPALMSSAYNNRREQQHSNTRPSLARQQQMTELASQNTRELAATLRDLPRDWTLNNVHQLLVGFGVQPMRIDMDASKQGQGSAFVRFNVPIPVPGWVRDGMERDIGIGERQRMRIRQDDGRGRQRYGQGDSRYPSEIKISGARIHFGAMLNEYEMMEMETVSTNRTQEPRVQLLLDKERGNVDFCFSVLLRDHEKGSLATHSFKFQIPISQIRHVLEERNDDDTTSFVITLNAPPLGFRKIHDVAKTMDAKDNVWSEWQMWYRQTSLTSNRSGGSNNLIELQNDDTLIDIGRWLTYRFVCDQGVTEISLRYLRCALRDHNIAVQLKPIQSIPRPPYSLWTWLGNTRDASIHSGSALSALDDTSAGKVFLPFMVRYQLEVCVSQGYLHEVSLDLAFGLKLAELGADRGMRLLEKVAELKQRIFNPMDIFRMQGSMPRRKMLSYCTIVRTATITPTTVYFNSPSLDTSNRVIRHFSQHADRFLRVKFRDESYKGTIMSFDDDRTDELFERIKRTMTNGIVVGDRHYEFLAYGNSQFREAGAYFFAPTGNLTAAKIRAWMGNFDDIKVVAKYASRVGQCFSTTRAMLNTGSIERIPDIKRNGFCFTDGVGKISPFLAMMTCCEMGLPDSREECASVFQFRLGGCKGVLAVDPSLMGKKIQIRPSQEKFPADYNGLEICRISQFSTAYLNQQIVLVLSALGVTDSTLITMLRNMLSDLELAMTDEVMALGLLSRNIDLNQTTVTIASMIVDGFMQSGDPFTMSILRLWRSWSTKYLKEKAKIFVEQGAFILGVVDETGSLKGHSNDTPADCHDQTQLPEIFVQISDPEAEGKGKFKVITGVCVLARNPSLHPGDIRVVFAVDKPELRHLRNCVVLPQTGDRDIASMCSGGDLDGDDYLVIWDPALLPKEWNHAPMDYAAPSPVVSDGPVTVEDMMSFFVTHMKNDTLSRIATAHRYLADKEEDGIKHESCIELAALHSKAVDYAKTGVPSEFPKHLRVTSWPHWAEKKDKRSYRSRKILGKLYDEVDRVPFVPAWNSPFDIRVLTAYDLPEHLLTSVREVKTLYDESLRRIMTQHGIASEFEAWTTFVLDHNHESRDYKIAEELGETMATLKDTFKELCYEKAGTTKSERKWEVLGPWVAGMYVVTAEEVGEANRRVRERSVRGGMLVQNVRQTAENMPFMSFPWMFRREMGEIANKRGSSGGGGGSGGSGGSGSGGSGGGGNDSGGSGGGGSGGDGCGGDGSGGRLALSVSMQKLATKKTIIDLTGVEALPELEEIDVKSYKAPTTKPDKQTLLTPATKIQQQDFPSTQLESRSKAALPKAVCSPTIVKGNPTTLDTTKLSATLVGLENVKPAAGAFAFSPPNVFNGKAGEPNDNSSSNQTSLPQTSGRELSPVPSLSNLAARSPLRDGATAVGTKPAHTTASKATEVVAEPVEKAGEVVELKLDVDGLTDKLDRLSEMMET
ncbi:hypothetical protein B0A48_13130 [Cryoendolithus antarcticus]|uniref:RDRP core domain-containing protein n=1 Tax=Cryoendolithus antarcticus TaxID=1507870 RepID=A0A1V8SNI8_9PEZI|nr:hypothetical protein B0A48_13130 [Cryoendolithus antarcticus]